MALTGKIALITGGTGGLGKAFATQLLKRGANVSLADFDASGRKVVADLNTTYGDGRVTFVQCDVTNKTQLEDAFATTKREFGGAIDILFNNAGVAWPSWKDFEAHVAINLTAVIRGTILGQKEMQTTTGGKGGCIVNVASVAGLNPLPMSPVYAATKAGVINLTKSLGHLAADGVRVNALCPAFTDTAMVAKAMEDPMGRAAVESLGRVMRPEEVAEAAMKLVEDESLAGQIMRVTNRGHEILPHKRSRL